MKAVGLVRMLWRKRRGDAREKLCLVRRRCVVRIEV
jgi:hypothetical protein